LLDVPLAIVDPPLVAAPFVEPVGIVPLPMIDNFVTFVYLASFILITVVSVLLMLHDGRFIVTSPTLEVVISFRQALISVVVQAPAVTVLPDHVPHAAHEIFALAKRIVIAMINLFISPSMRVSNTF
jgi:hypothetical protein